MDIAVPFLIQQACIICKIRFAKKKKNKLKKNKKNKER